MSYLKLAYHDFLESCIDKPLIWLGWETQTAKYKIKLFCDICQFYLNGNARDSLQLITLFL